MGRGLLYNYIPQLSLFIQLLHERLVRYKCPLKWTVDVPIFLTLTVAEMLRALLAMCRAQTATTTTSTAAATATSTTTITITTRR